MGSKPKMPPAIPPPPPAPDQTDRAVLDAKRRERRRQLSLSARSSRIGTSAQGAPGNPTLGYQTLLGGGQ